MKKPEINTTKKHYLKSRSSYIVVLLKSLRHKGCVCCNYPIKSLEESSEHWDEMLIKDKDPITMGDIKRQETENSQGKFKFINNE